MGLHVEIRENLWQAYRLLHPATFEEAKQPSNTIEDISRAKDELVEKKAKKIFEEEHRRKRSGHQNQLEETVHKLWTQDRLLRDTKK